jgi:hypothetical protein
MLNNNRKEEKDLREERSLEALYQAKFRLEAAIRKAIICVGCVDLYPEGSDKEIAKSDVDNARYALVKAVANYDVCYTTYNAIREENGREFDRRFETSHEMVETFYGAYTMVR